MGDIRLDRRGEQLFERVVAKHTLVLKSLGGHRRDEAAFNRLLKNETIDPATLLAPHIERAQRAIHGRSIVVAQDTTEINFSGRAGRRKGLGPAGDGVSPGFFIHPLVAIESKEGAVLGVLDAQIWTRPETKVEDHKGRAAEDKESHRWLVGARVAAERCKGATRVVVVGDRESDIYHLFAQRPEGIELLVRAAQDRTLEDGQRLKDVTGDWRVLDTREVEVAAKRVGAAGGPRVARTARVATRSGTVTIKRPGRAGNRGDAPSVTLGLVVVLEIDPPAGVEPLAWWLLTTLPVTGKAASLEVVRLYRLRWRIEEVFRTLKTDGLDLEASQVTEAARLFKLAAVGLVAAVRIVQLVDARDGSTRPATDAIDAAQIPAAAAIGKGLEGGTKRQKNPFRHGTLAWLSWIIARLGGWNCYYRPPGPKTMANGWRRLSDRLQGFELARSLSHV